MSWQSPSPIDRWSDKEKVYFMREVWTRAKFGAITWDPPNVPATSAVATTLAAASYPTVRGLRVGMPIRVTPPSTLDDAISVEAWVATDDTLTIRLKNTSGVGVDMASGTWAFAGTVL